MKNLRLIPLLCIMFIFMNSNALVPKTETKCRWMKVTDVERTDSALRVGIRLQNYPRYWVRVDSGIHLTASDDTTRLYKVIATENIDLNVKIWMPASGYHEGVIVFEKIPEDVSVVDLIETNRANVGSCIFGIQLDEEDPAHHPDMFTMTDILALGNDSVEKWHGVDPGRYSDLKFYNPTGVTHLRGRITDYSPKSGVSTFSIRTKDDFTNLEKINVGEINPDGTFAIDIPVTYPQFDYFSLGNIAKGLFLIPGDTLSIVTCMAMRIDPEAGHVPEYFGFNGKLSDGSVINMLKDSVNTRYDLNKLFGRFHVEESDSVSSETYRLNLELASLFDSVMNDLPVFLGKFPVSEFAKDILAIYAIGEIYETMEDIQMSFKSYNGPRVETDADGNKGLVEGEKLDDIAFLAPWLKHKDLIYNNPLIICDGWVLPNRWMFNSQFTPTSRTAQGLEAVPEHFFISQYSENLADTYSKDLNRLDSIGLGNCFVAQFIRTATLNRILQDDDEPSLKKLNLYNRIVLHAIRNNEYTPLSEILMGRLNDYVMNATIAEKSISGEFNPASGIPDTPEGKVLARIIEPYKGNVLYLDFWGIGCGPCRAGMINQKPLLEALSDKPFKALYIADTEYMDSCKKWLEKEGIQGEHIFISKDDWQRLCGLFNFSAIPFGVLIGRDGNIIKTDYQIYAEDLILKKALE